MSGATSYSVAEWNGSSWQTIGTYSSGTTGIQVNGLNANTTYYFEVGASNSAGTTWSSYVGVTTKAAATNAVVTYHGGGVLPHVEVQALYLGSDWSTNSALHNQTGQTEGFLNNIVNSSYMDMLTNAGYGVGRGTSTSLYRRPATCPAFRVHFTRSIWASIATMLFTSVPCFGKLSVPYRTAILASFSRD